jgi:hypothetical protein
VQIDRAEAEARKLAIENDRLQVEKRAQATPLRVEKLASRSIAHADGTTPAITQYVALPAPQASEVACDEPQERALHLQPLAGQQDAGLAQQVHCGGHCPGVRGLAGRAAYIQVFGNDFFPAPG